MKKSSSNRANHPNTSPTGSAQPGATAATPLPEKALQLTAPAVPVEAPKPRAQAPEVCSVTFEYFSPVAKEVLVAGSFNGWQPKALPMRHQLGGKWSAEIFLKPGQYEYRFVVDGQWRDDPMAARFIANSFGGLNCVIQVQAPEEALAAGS